LTFDVDDRIEDSLSDCGLVEGGYIPDVRPDTPKNGLDIAISKDGTAYPFGDSRAELVPELIPVGYKL
jgi:hypothetical protein